MTPYEILQYYYGDDIEHRAQRHRSDIQHWLLPRRPTDHWLGRSNEVTILQTELNRIRQQLSRHPQDQPRSTGCLVPPPRRRSGPFRAFLTSPQTGVVDKSTWYQIKYIYTSVMRLSRSFLRGAPSWRTCPLPLSPPSCSEGDAGRMR